MSKHSENEYTFPCVVIRANELNLLSKADLEKLIDAKSIQSAMNVLYEFGYGDGKDLTNPRDFDLALRKSLEEMYDLVFSISPDEKEVKLFLYPNDYHNAKVLLKAEFLKTDPTPYLVHTGSIGAEQITDMVRKRDFSLMSLEMRNAVTEAIDIFSKGRDPQEIDLILDRACYRDMMNDALDSGSDFVCDYMRLLIDILNVNALVRLREIGKPKSFFEKVLLDGGNIDQKQLANGYDDAYAQLAERYAPFGFREIFAIGAQEVHDSGKYTNLERLCDDLKMDYVRDAKLVPFGIEPIVGYLIAKESEIKNLRVIFTGKIAGTSAEVIKERLRETYV